jgi:hypothetical protein
LYLRTDLCSKLDKVTTRENTSIDSNTTDHKPKHLRGKTQASADSNNQQQHKVDHTLPAKASLSDEESYYIIQKCIIIK